MTSDFQPQQFIVPNFNQLEVKNKEACCRYCDEEGEDEARSLDPGAGAQLRGCAAGAQVLRAEPVRLVGRRAAADDADVPVRPVREDIPAAVQVSVNGPADRGEGECSFVHNIQ